MAENEGEGTSKLSPVGGGGPLASSVALRAIDHMRGVASAISVPLSVSFRDGHVRSALARKSQDARGRPVPSYSYPAIEFLSEVDWSHADVLEFGGGQSTLWWSDRARHVMTVEEDSNWFAYLHQKLASRPNVECVLENNSERYAAVPRGRTFDVVIVDGGNRPLAAETAAEVVGPDGIIVVDDAEAWVGARPGDYPIIATLRDAGFRRIDFIGYAPGVRRKHATSVFFRSGPALFAELPPPPRSYRR